MVVILVYYILLCSGCGLVAKLCLNVCNPMDYIAHQAPLSMGFPRQKQGSRFPFPSPGDLPNPGIEPRCPALQADSLPSKPQGKPHILLHIYHLLLHQILLLQGSNRNPRLKGKVLSLL